MNIADLSLELSQVQIQDEHALEQFRIRFLGSKNVLKDLYAAIKDIPNDQKRAYGQQVNALKERAEQIFHEKKTALAQVQQVGAQQDHSRPASDPKVGAHHPLSLIRREIIEIFNRIGFVVSEGPEIEDDWHNFSALNFPPEHPARDMQDTFFIEKGAQEIALRTHTSSVQVRVMENQAPPIRTISPGRVLISRSGIHDSIRKVLETTLVPGFIFKIVGINRIFRLSPKNKVRTVACEKSSTKISRCLKLSKFCTLARCALRIESATRSGLYSMPYARTPYSLAASIGMTPSPEPRS